MDIVYIMGKGSIAQDEEIRYSLRSIHRHMLDIGKVYVVGDLPDFLKGIKHLKAEDEYEDKWKNAWSKTNTACKDKNLTETFLLMNDDFFANKDFKGEDVPFYIVPNVDGGPNGKHYFGVHAPIQIHKEFYTQLPLNVEMKGDWSPRSFYANFYRAKTTPTEDFVIRSGEGMKPYGEQVKSKPFFSIDNHTMTVLDFATWIEQKFPEPSPWEL